MVSSGEGWGNMGLSLGVVESRSWDEVVWS